MTKAYLGTCMWTDTAWGSGISSKNPVTIEKIRDWDKNNSFPKNGACRFIIKSVEGTEASNGDKLVADEVNNIDSVWMDPDISVTLWDGYTKEDAIKSGRYMTVGNNQYAGDLAGSKIGRNAADYVRVRKECTADRWKWDPTCLSGNSDSTVDGCQGDKYPGSACRTKQRADCLVQGMDFDSNQNCRWFCSQTVNKADCKPYVQAFCQNKLKNTGNIASDVLCQELNANNEVNEQVCRDGANLATAACQTYCSTNPGSAACQASIPSYCTGNNLKTDWCQKILTRSEIWGKMDPAMSAYCKGPEMKDVAICGCLNSTTQDEYIKQNLNEPELLALANGIRSKPQCYFNKCNAGAYQTDGMRTDKTCPSIKVCTNKVGDVNKIKGTNNNIVLENNCGDTIQPNSSTGSSTSGTGAGTSGTGSGSGTGTTNKSPSSSNSTTSSSSDSYSWSSKYLWFGGGAGAFILSVLCSCCVVFILIMMVMMLKKRRR